MAKIIKQRMTAEIEGDFVIFLIGMRINSFWKIHKWLPVALAMPKMIKELYAKPEIGFLGVQTLGGIPPGMVQYWRSFEQLDAYANNRDLTHFPDRPPLEVERDGHPVTREVGGVLEGQGRDVPAHRH